MSDRDSRDEVRHTLEEFGLDDTMSASKAAFEADLSVINSDDALLDALGGSDPESADDLGDQDLNALLLAWRRDIDSEPLAELVDTDTAVTTVRAASLAQRHGKRARRRRLLVPIAAAAAVLVIAFTGTGVAARSAQPGDTLWGLTKMLYADHARSVEAASAARTDLQQASIALAQGNILAAQQALAAAAAKLRQVAEEDNLSQLMAEHRHLSDMLQHPGQVVSPPPSSSTATSVTSSSSSSPSSSPSTTSTPSSSTTPSTSSPSSLTPPPTSTSTVSGLEGSSGRSDTSAVGPGLSPAQAGASGSHS
ncbi:anti-sigma-D factor RsdA [Amycolatopsis pigmentata]|uniref:Anti-sigma-D factor RsdA n=1 Tax=Amycolatopsis pigmentata TaxID=450801 RepID=A0ABW5G3L4_9PSEU